MTDLKQQFDKFYQEGLEKAPAALQRLADRLQAPPEPIMSQAEFEALPPIRKAILGCNMPGCDKVISTHYMLCVEHEEEFQKKPPIPFTIVEAGVDPDHQTDHCDECKHVFEEDDEVIPTCTHEKHVTLCRSCYTKAGSSVR